MPNREGLIKHWSVVEAFRNGKKVQWRDRDREVWVDLPAPGFVVDHEYRIKPEKKTVWLNLYPKMGFATKEQADAGAGCSRLACIQITSEEGEGL